MLKLEKLRAGYGQCEVLFEVSLDVAEGEVVTLMGRNGMGKTTTIRSIMGLLRPSAGSIDFRNASIFQNKPEYIARTGIGLVPEGREIFSTLTVRENLIATAANHGKHASPWTLKRIYSLFPRLEERARQMAGTLSGGEQQMLAIGRALMTNPRLLILDEATEGLAPLIRADIWACLKNLKAEGQSILVIDKDLKELRRLADRHYIIEKGCTVWSGGTAELDADFERVQSYVGL